MDKATLELIRLVEGVIGNLSKDYYGYRAAHNILDWPTRASIVTAIHNVKEQGRN